MVSNDLRKELNNIGIKVHITNKDVINFEKDGKITEVEVSTIRKVFLNSLVSYIDNIS
jgi:hypothetical protein